MRYFYILSHNTNLLNPLCILRYSTSSQHRQAMFQVLNSYVYQEAAVSDSAALEYLGFWEALQ